MVAEWLDRMRIELVLGLMVDWWIQLVGEYGVEWTFGLLVVLLDRSGQGSVVALLTLIICRWMILSS
jgi:hypothetical protein